MGSPSRRVESTSAQPGSSTGRASLELSPSGGCMTHRWDNIPAREEYFQRVVAPAIRDADTFYLLTHSLGYNELTGDYPEGVQTWVQQTFPNRFTAEPLKAGSGILLLRFQRN